MIYFHVQKQVTEINFVCYLKFAFSDFILVSSGLS